MDFAKLNPREQVAIVALGSIMILGIFSRVVNQPIAKKVLLYKSQIKRQRIQLNELKSKVPSFQKQKNKVDVLRTECAALLTQIKQMEKDLPPRSDTSQLIGELTRLAKESQLLSLRQKTTGEGEYSRILVEIQLQTSFEDAIGFIKKVESISPFLMVEEMELAEPKAKSIAEQGVPLRLLVSSLLGESEIASELKAKEGEEFKIKRDILVSKVRPTRPIKEAQLKLDGITFSQGRSTAIINGDVFRVGSEVEGFKIIKILPESVVLNDGAQDQVLEIIR